MVGVNKYSDPNIPSLETALPDAQAVGQQMKDSLGYEVRVVPDASRADIITSLNKLAREVGPNDSVTVYYAGHGYLNEKTGNGYWIPGDAKASSPDNWILPFGKGPPTNGRDQSRPRQTLRRHDVLLGPLRPHGQSGCRTSK